jgi:hypothetical protein
MDWKHGGAWTKHTPGPSLRSQDAILRFVTDIQSGGEFFYDSNGLEFVRSVRDQRPWQVGNWTDYYDPHRETVASNYVPVNLATILSTKSNGSHPTNGGALSHNRSAASTAASAPVLAVLPTGFQGAASLFDGSLELMVNRAVVKGTSADPESCENSTGNHLITQHNVIILGTGGVAGISAALRPVAAAIANPLLIFTSQGMDSIMDSRAVKLATVTSRDDVPAPVPSPVPVLATALPPQLELLTLLMLPPRMNVSFGNGSSTGGAQPPVDSSVLLLRIRHIYARGDGGEQSGLGAPVTLDLGTAFAPRFTIVNATEMTLDGMQTLAESRARQANWTQAKTSAHVVVDATGNAAEQTEEAGLKVTIAPMEVRTWVIGVEMG